MASFTMPYAIRWADLDGNGHVRYSAYIDATADLRYHYFAQHGFPPQAFVALGISPVYTSMTAEFLREVFLGETVTITYEVAGLSPLGSRWRVRHDFLKDNGKKAVTVALEGVLLNLATRKPVLPSAELLKVMQELPRARDFEVMTENRWV
jgi:acyl-CoA thioester hydrolase